MLIDTHAHLTDVKLVQKLADVLAEAQGEGVEKIITIGTSLADSKQAIKLAQRYSEVCAGVGVYPDEDQRLSISTISASLSNLANQSKVVGIGETGVDIPKEGAPFNLARQLELFEAHIEISSDTKLPLIIHNRGADTLVYDTLIKYKDKLKGGVFHCYTGDSEFALKVISLGFYISFSGILTYKNAGLIQDTARKIPIDRILIETDAPYLAPHPFRGQICEPKHVKTTANRLAELLNMSPEKVEEITYNNAVSLFPLLGKII
jgi:TatD DNase family protein